MIKGPGVLPGKQTAGVENGSSADGNPIWGTVCIACRFEQVLRVMPDAMKGTGTSKHCLLICVMGHC